jgi:two-component system CAI-1 autoinducer sensor kinase/phosphatase CqsS
VVEVEHGQAVLDALRGEERFDAVIVDIQMPGLDGLETTRAIRASGETWANLPVVALTARSDAATVEAAREAGMNAFLVKPVDAPLLYDTLAPLLAGLPQETPLQPMQQEIAIDEGLLNLQRLDSYKRLGMLEELLDDYLPEMDRLVRVLAEAAERRDPQRSLDALHSLLGMSGEAGALALYQLVRRVYVPLLEQGQWPAAGGWIAQLQALEVRTRNALRAYCASESRAGTA